MGTILFLCNHDYSLSPIATLKKPESNVPLPINLQPMFSDKRDKDDNSKAPLEVRQGFSNAPFWVFSMTPGQQQNCEICHKKNRGEEMLLCDGCDCGTTLFLVSQIVSAYVWLC